MARKPAKVPRDRPAPATEAGRPAGAAPPVPHNPRRRRGVVLLLSAVLGGIGIAGWIGWRAAPAPVPPALSLDGAEPAVVHAIEAAVEAVHRMPRSAAAWGHLGKVLQAHAYPHASDECYAHAERLAPEDPRWPYLQGTHRALENPRAALPYFQRAAALCEPQSEPWRVAQLQIAELLLGQGRLSEAEETLGTLARRSGTGDARRQYALGLLAAAHQDWEQTEAHFAHCVRSPFVRKKACIQLVMACRHLGQETAAAQWAERARQLPRDWNWPDPFTAEYQKLAVSSLSRNSSADQLEIQGRLQEALEIRREQVARVGNAKSYMGLGLLLNRLGRREDAEAALREAIRLDPQQPQAFYYLCLVHFAQAKDLEAREDQRSRRRNLYEQAAEAAHRARELRHDHAAAYLYEGWALEQISRRTRAIAAFRMAAQCRPEWVEPHLSLGKALAEEGRIPDAIRHLERAARVAGPDDSRASEALARVRGIRNGSAREEMSGT